jgi:hypothetical protein
MQYFKGDYYFVKENESRGVMQYFKEIILLQKKITPHFLILVHLSFPDKSHPKMNKKKYLYLYIFKFTLPYFDALMMTVSREFCYFDMLTIKGV